MQTVKMDHKVQSMKHSLLSMQLGFRKQMSMVTTSFTHQLNMLHANHQQQMDFLQKVFDEQSASWMQQINEMENEMVVTIVDPMGMVQAAYAEDEQKKQQDEDEEHQQQQQQDEDDVKLVVDTVIKIKPDEDFLDALQLQRAGASDVQIVGTSSTTVHRNRAHGSKRVRRLKRDRSPDIWQHPGVADKEIKAEQLAHGKQSRPVHYAKKELGAFRCWQCRKNYKYPSGLKKHNEKNHPEN